jgi:hypothetical protein
MTFLPSSRALSILGIGLGTIVGCAGARDGNGKLAGPASATGSSEAGMAIGITAVGNVPPEVAAQTSRIWGLAAKARKLKPKEPVRLAVLDGVALVGVVKKHVKDEVPPDVIRAEGRAFETLGLIPPGYKYEEETYALLEEELAGLYMPEDKTMYVALGIDGVELDATLSHELVHALQDQYFEIGKKMKFQQGASDALGALQSLAEGDATSAMIDEVILSKKGEDGLAQMNASDLPDRGPEEFLDESLQEKKGDAAIKRAPRFLALGLVAPYADGLAFVNALRRRGGWAAVDAAWGKPPITTEQLLHVDKYDAFEPAVDVKIATAAALGAGWKQTYDDGFGEQEGRLAFTTWMTTYASRKAAGGWGGDRVTLFEGDGDKHAVAWKIVFDTPAEATEAGALLNTGWAAAYGTAQKKGDVDVYGIPAPPAKTADDGKGGVKKPGPLDKKEPGKKPDAKDGKEKSGKLPELPDATGGTSVATPLAPPKPNVTNGCRSIAVTGKTLTMLAGAPCDVIAAWSAEVSK